MAPDRTVVASRTPSKNRGQGATRAKSIRTGWHYEHDETDAQIAAIEDLIFSIREKEGVELGDPQSKRGATFTWGSSTDEGEGDILIGTTHAVPGDGVVLVRGDRLEGFVWKTESWIITPDGTVTPVKET